MPWNGPIFERFISPMMEEKLLQDAVIQRHNDYVQQLSDANLIDGFHVLQEVVALVRARVAQSTCSGAAGVFHPRSASMAPECNDIGRIFDHPLLLTETSSDHIPLSMDTFSATILFNLALVCHRMGTLYGSERSLRQASRLYLIVNELLKECSTRHSIVLLSLAIHNLGHLQQAWGNYAGYHRCMEALWNLMPRCWMEREEIEHHLLISLRLWKCAGPPMAAAA